WNQHQAPLSLITRAASMGTQCRRDPVSSVSACQHVVSATCDDRGMPIDQHLLLAFLLTTTIAMITPGPDMLFILGCGMRSGPRAGLLATAGVATSEAVHVAVAAAGLAALFAAVPVAFTAVRIVGA